MKVDANLIRQVRARLEVSIADARSALRASGEDVDEACAALRAAGIAELRSRTGAQESLAAETFDGVRGDLERATVRLTYLLSPEPPSAIARTLRETSPPADLARDLHSLIGGFDGDGSARDAVYLIVDLFVQIGADGLSGFADNIGRENLRSVVDAAGDVGLDSLQSELRALEDRCRNAEVGLDEFLQLEQRIVPLEAQALERVVQFARERPGEIDI